MREQKEILIQDVSKPKEIRRFREHHIYRRPITFGSPLYFSPYFTRGAKQLEGEGISYLSKILGIITLKPQDIANYRDDLLSFTESYSLVNAWIQGVKFDGRTKKLHTYYFLNAPIRLKRPLRKDGTIKKGRGKGWIAAQIPPNRCVTFEEFMKRAQ